MSSAADNALIVYTAFFAEPKNYEINQETEASLLLVICYVTLGRCANVT